MKLVLLLILAVMFSKTLAPAAMDPLDAWYRGYNEVYFQNELPNTVYITHDLTDDRYMAVTDRLPLGVYHINFNVKYGYTPIPGGISVIELRNLLHESCHVQVFIEEKEDEFDDHGPKWQSCMHRLANMGAFNALW